MHWLLLFLWFLGAAAGIVAVAIAQAERVTRWLVTDECASCGYSLVGLRPSQNCPECNNSARRARVALGSIKAADFAVLLWTVPIICGIVMAIIPPLLPGATKATVWLAVPGVVVPFLLLSVILRITLRWAPGAAVARMLTTSVVLMLCVMLAANLLTLFGIGTLHPEDVAVFGGTIALPFGGYGMLIGLFSIPAEVFVRERVRAAA